MCDTAVRLTDDGPLFAKNSDRDPNEAQVLEWHGRADHPSDTRLTCTWVDIDQASHTHAVLLSRPFWMWGAEMGANEHGVVIGNEAVFTTEPYAASGLTGMDLLRLALERATTAEQAVATIIELIEQHGQGGGCGHEQRGFTYHNSYLVADPAGAIVLETAGRRWATEVVDGPARSISNVLTVEPFASAHSERVRTRVSAGMRRRRRTTERATQAESTGELMTMLRDHGAGRSQPHYALLNGAMAAPCMHAGGLLANSQTTASWVADLRNGEQHWATATAAPCTSLFKPVRVGEPLDLGPPPADERDDSLWWRHERLHRVAVRDPTALYPLFTPEREATELAWLTDPPSSAEAFAEADDLLERWTRQVSARAGDDRRPPWTRRYWRIRDERSHHH